MAYKRAKTLGQTMPPEFLGSAFSKTQAFRMKDIEVIEEHNHHYDQDEYQPWPGTHKNVHFWVKLTNGYAVALNENPSRGWSFPVMKLPITPMKCG